MSVDLDHLLYNITSTFSTKYNVSMNEDTIQYLSDWEKYDKELNSDDKKYYVKYSVKIVKSLFKHLGNITFYEINTNPMDDIVHDFRVCWGSKNKKYISLNHKTIAINDIIPKYMKTVCGWNIKSDTAQEYKNEYNELNDKIYDEISDYNNFSEISTDDKMSIIYKPMCELIYNTLDDKQQYTENIYRYLFREKDRIVFRAYLKSFKMYDFGNKIDKPSNYEISIDSEHENILVLEFDNEVKFKLSMKTNSTKINSNISLKLVTTMCNLADMFGDESVSILK